MSNFKNVNINFYQVSLRVMIIELYNILLLMDDKIIEKGLKISKKFYNL